MNTTDSIVINFYFLTLVWRRNPQFIFLKEVGFELYRSISKM
ncbi:hypothetical protein LEP1GSC021_1507 [Leptospira noguchii str. 1993005606]|uniref:Uncharacterized protein n=1 Tax=Leptospira noguchii str. 2007001578 TaxID=1049974 RepID=A0ABP2T7K8_9LEPT|nr:hypothetical protein LEP1GSC035_4640 [Leptospira noguchii str. 2007001578]EPE83097.1 hypothetical protein LEP1GSC021_1507 [Leptospira noguchii str. 1993005606]